MMSTTEQMLSLYREAAAVTSEILAHAREADWERVLALGDEYLALVEEIKSLSDVPPLDAEERAQKYELIVNIMENDAATRNLAVPSLERLGALIGTMRRQQSLMKTYGRAATAGY
jgi:flagellar protein FliT